MIIRGGLEFSTQTSKVQFSTTDFQPNGISPQGVLDKAAQCHRACLSWQQKYWQVI